MQVSNLETTYKCYSSIGNCLDLSEMMSEVVKTFVEQTNAFYALYCVEYEKKVEEIASFGTITEFEPKLYKNYTQSINRVDEEMSVIILRLEYGSIFLVEKESIDKDFFLEMFKSFIPKLNLSIKSCLNIKKLKDTNKLLKEQKEQLQLANKAKDIFLANMSHELKTPLNSINVISSVMKENRSENLTQRDIKNLQIINSSGKYLLDLINDVLDLSKLESKRVVVDYSQINLYKLLKEIYSMFLPQTQEKKIKLHFEYDKKITEVYSDEKKIKQIVKNLLSNAVKFVEGGKAIYLKAKDEDDQVTISVEDQGIGIPQNRLSDIFDRFKQADSSTTRKFGGTGLGLAITKELLELLKGSIFVKSEVGKGTTFYATVPKNSEAIKCLDILDLEEQSSKVNKKEGVRNETKIQVHRNILLYNTDAVKFINIVILLQKVHTLKQVTNLEELFQNANSSFDVIILDSAGISKHELNLLKEIFKNDIYVIKGNIVDITDIEEFIGRRR
ncbi:sensor histidine kinase [Halarcobacter anaerophilus]|uniref:histidine kinase n=1 Tax=Halarcobacter anaerophilus TaxID=877500 RepID=A0A4Q0Y5Y3_9BACT|nr:HAMP domain-containing sensor histidine kinase [Halarcobacter anaerophilus]QDF29559.1 signal transduction sensor histidine kinase [Halarcobacter anaerophilus]RXJ64794.1 hypothetical protein CRV06_02240 [Halarcobacter anaerophilus]